MGNYLKKLMLCKISEDTEGLYTLYTPAKLQKGSGADIKSEIFDLYPQYPQRKCILCSAFLLTVSMWKDHFGSREMMEPRNQKESMEDTVLLLLVVVTLSDCIYSLIFCFNRVLMCFFLCKALTSCLELLVHYLVNSAGHQ